MRHHKDVYDRLKFDDPCPEEHMVGRNDRRFICHVLRQIYQMTDDPEIKLKTRIASTMAKKMSFMLQDKGIGWKEIWATDEEVKEI